MQNHINRFSHVVANYQKYRPHYPQQIVTLLINECGLTADSKIADIGSGTGFLTQLFLANGNTVYAIEPNDEMRQVAEQNFAKQSKFHSIAATAENTSLPNDSVDIVTAATAFHWFDAQASKQEFKRILTQPGFVCLVWNIRDIEHSQFMVAYETLIQDYCLEYKGSKAEQFNHTVTGFFEPYVMHTQSFPNEQVFDWEGLQGRLLSTSYCLPTDHPKFSEMLAALKRIFERYQVNNNIRFLYQTKVYYGQLK